MYQYTDGHEVVVEFIQSEWMVGIDGMVCCVILWKMSGGEIMNEVNELHG